jgi:hypothetical protein
MKLIRYKSSPTTNRTMMRLTRSSNMLNHQKEPGALASPGTPVCTGQRREYIAKSST